MGRKDIAHQWAFVGIPDDGSCSFLSEEFQVDAICDLVVYWYRHFDCEIPVFGGESLMMI